ncbi:MAG: hypothetical protein ACK5NF_06330 [Bacilli bacterium]
MNPLEIIKGLIILPKEILELKLLVKNANVQKEKVYRCVVLKRTERVGFLKYNDLSYKIEFWNVTEKPIHYIDLSLTINNFSIPLIDLSRESFENKGEIEPYENLSIMINADDFKKKLNERKRYVRRNKVMITGIINGRDIAEIISNKLLKI